MGQQPEGSARDYRGSGLPDLGRVGRGNIIETRTEGEDEMMFPLNPLWTSDEDDELRSLILASKDTATIASELNRTPKAIRRRAEKLKLPLKFVIVGLKAKGK
jgi:Myb-like DNA-binding domain